MKTRLSCIGAMLAVLFASSAARSIQQEDISKPTPVPGSFAAAAGSQHLSPQEELKRLPYAPGHLIVKLKDSVTACVDCLVQKGQALAPALGSQHIDDLNRHFGLRQVRPLRQFDGGTKSLADRRRLESIRQDRMLQAATMRLGPAVPAQVPSFASTYIFELSPWMDMEQVAREYARDPAVAYAEPDRRVHVQLTPNDPYFSSAGAWKQGFDDLWGIKLIDAPAAWDVAQGENVIVAVTDTGVDTSHPDIAANMWVNPGEIAGNGVDDDGNGYVDDVNGWNFAYGNSNVFDDFGHGTHVAGTIAAVGQNGVGVIGVAWKSKIMAVKALDASGSGNLSDLANAILYAAENHANVINASWGGVGQSQTIDDAIATADAAGAVFVAAAGNSNADVETASAGPFFPASNPRAITAAAFDHTDQKAFFSNFGTKIDVAAPGGGDGGPMGDFRSVLSLLSSGAGMDMTGVGTLIVGGKYLRQAGTSMAAPHVAGAAAVILSAHPSYSPAQVRQALRAGADDVGAPGFDTAAGYGRVNVDRSVRLTALSVQITDPIRRSVASGPETQLPVLGSASGDGFVSYTVEYGSGDLPTTWTPIAGPISAPVDNGTLALWDVSGVPDGTYVVRLRADSSAGLTFEDRVPIVLDHVIVSAPTGYSETRGGGPIEIRGTAGGAGFTGYTVEYRLIGPDLIEGPWTTAGLSVTGGGAGAVFNDVLATFDSSVLPGGRDLDFRLTVATGNGPRTDQAYHVVIDSTLRAGWPRQIPGLPNRFARMRSAITLADIDGDGTKEILTAYGDLVFAMRADGSDVPGWPQSVASSVPYAFIDSAPAAADLDGDGRLEVVAANYDSIFIWHDDGTPLAGWPKPFIDKNYYILGVPEGDVALTDLDGDGQRDIVFAMGQLLMAIHSDGSSLPGFPVRRTCDYLSPPCFEQVLAVGDVDGDGSKDIAIVGFNEADRQMLYVYDAGGQLKPGWPKKVTQKADVSYDGNYPVLADVNGDGRLDIVVNTDSARRVGVFRGTGKPIGVRPGGREYSLRYPPYGTFHSKQDPVSAGDITGDGGAEVFAASDFPDIITRCRNYYCSWTFLLPPYIGADYLTAMSAGRTRLTGWPIAFPFPSADKAYGPGAPVIGDIDGDGRQEVVVGSGTCAMWDPIRKLHRCYTLYAYRANGTLLPGFPKPTASPGATKWIMPALGDLAGDGLKEIVWVDFNGNVLVWNVDGTPGPERMQWPMYRHDPAHTGALVANP